MNTLALIGQAYNSIIGIFARGNHVRSRSTSQSDEEEILNRNDVAQPSPQRRRINDHLQPLPRLKPFSAAGIYRDIRRPLKLDLTIPLYSQHQGKKERVIFQNRVWINEKKVLSSRENWTTNLSCSGMTLGRGHSCPARATCTLTANENGVITSYSEFRELKDHAGDCLPSEAQIIHLKAKQQLVEHIRRYGGIAADRYKEMIDELKSEATPEDYRSQRLYATFYSLQSIRSTLDR
jgi:hypothetical protein